MSDNTTPALLVGIMCGMSYFFGMLMERYVVQPQIANCPTCTPEYPVVELGKEITPKEALERMGLE